MPFPRMGHRESYGKDGAWTYVYFPAEFKEFQEDVAHFITLNLGKTFPHGRLSHPGGLPSHKAPPRSQPTVPNRGHRSGELADSGVNRAKPMYLYSGTRFLCQVLAS